ncbi:MAG: hypothetical protein ACLSCY_02230 [Clostridium sp.]
MKTRMRFVKCGSMKFDTFLRCVFQKAIRCKIDVAYSKVVPYLRVLLRRLASV